MYVLLDVVDGGATFGLLKRDLYRSKDNYKRDLCMPKRDLCMSKEAYVCQKRPIYVLLNVAHGSATPGTV